MARRCAECVQQFRDGKGVVKEEDGVMSMEVLKSVSNDLELLGLLPDRP